MNAVDAFQWLALIVSFLLLLIVPAALIESRAGRSWIRRLRNIERGRRAMADDTH